MSDTNNSQPHNFVNGSTSEIYLSQSPIEIKNELIRQCNLERQRLGHSELSYSIRERSIAQLQTLLDNLQKAEPESPRPMPSEDDIRLEQEIQDATIENRQEFSEMHIVGTDPDTGYSKGATWLLNEIWDYPHLNMGHKVIYQVLWRHCWQGKVCIIGTDRIGKQSSCSEKSVERYLYGYNKNGVHIPGLTEMTRQPNQLPSAENPPLVAVQRRPYHASRFILNYKPVMVRPIAKAKKNGGAH